MATNRSGPDPTTPPDPSATLRRRRVRLRSLARHVADQNAITSALVDLVSDAAGEVLRAVPPATNHAAAARLSSLLDSLHDSAMQGRRLAHRLISSLAREKKS